MRATELEIFADSLCASEREADPFINRGHGMAALTLFEASRTFSNDNYLASANRHLSLAMEQLDQLPLSNSLYRGVTGLGWIVKKYYNQIDGDWKSEFLVDLDVHLADGISDSENLNIDVVDGLAGIMIYANASGEAPRTNAYKALRSSIRDAIPGYLDRFLELSESKPKAYSNLGVAHGIPGLLTQCANFVTECTESGHLVASIGVAFDALWSHAVETDDAAWFPHFSFQTTPARLAWCYGSLGHYVAFDRARRISARQNGRCEKIMQGIRRQYSTNDGIRDASVCHGHAGLLALKAAIDSEAANQLAPLVEVAEQRTREAFIASDAGVAILYATENGMSPCRNFLEGAAGCALALGSLETKSKSNWLDLLGYN